MNRLWLLSLFLCAGAASAAVTGSVFMDRNGNGLRDRNESGLAEVAVSDGLNVVKTDAEGRFSLPADHAKARFVSLSIPNGARAARHYIPIAQETADYTFVLTPWKRSESGPHAFIQISDTETSGKPQPHYATMAENLRGIAASEQAAFIVHTGDICYEGGLREHIKLVNSENMDCPVFYTIGNHDLVRGRYGEALFEELYGPAWYSFNAGGTHYVVLPMPGGDHRPSYSTNDIAQWLTNDLAARPKGTPVVVFCHDLLFTGDRFVYGGVDLNAHNLKAWLYGHWHINYARRQGDVLTLSTAAPEKGGIDFSASVFRVLRNDPQGAITSAFRYAPVDGVLTVSTADGALIVNTYKTTAATRTVTAKSVSETSRPATAATRQSDWSWRLPATPGDHLLISATFADGSTLSREIAVPAKPDLLWSAHAGGEVFMSSPVVEGSRVFVGTTDEHLRGEGGVTAFEAETGKRLWHARTRNSVKNAIAVAEGRVFAQDAEGWVYAFSSETGALLWENKLPTAALPALVSGLTLQDDTLYAGAGQSLTAFNAADGAKRWQGGGWRLREGTPDRPVFIPVTVNNGVARDVLIQGSHWDALYANDAKTGKRLWTLSGPDFRFRGTLPAPDGSNVWIAARNTLTLLDPLTGQTQKKKDLGFSLETGGQPLVTEHLIVLSTVSEGLVALDRNTLNVAWELPVGEGLVFTPPYSHKPQTPIQGSPVRDRDTVYVGASDGTLYAADLTTGKLRWKHAFGAPLLGTPTLRNGRLYVADLGGNVHCRRLR